MAICLYCKYPCNVLIDQGFPAQGILNIAKQKTFTPDNA